MKTLNQEPLPPTPKKGGGAGTGRAASGESERQRAGLNSPSLLRGGGWGERFFALALVFALAGAVLAAPAADVAPAPRAAKPKFVAPRLNDSFEAIVFTNLRPVRVRLTLLQDGKSAGDAWRDRLQKAFDYCDRDADGSLDEKEAAFVFADQGMVQLLQNGFYQPVGAVAPTFAHLDRDGDKRVSFEEFVGYYVLSTAQVVRAQLLQPDNAGTAAVTEGIFKMLDANGDGKLTQDEVKAAEKLLATRDADEDECLSMQEFAPGVFNPNAGRRLGQEELLVQRSGNPYPVPAGVQPVIVYETGKVPGTVTQQVIKKYDKDDDFELTKAECGFDERTFKALDRDGNGLLDGEELDAWRTGAPDLSVTLSLAAKQRDCVATLADEKGAAARGFALKQSEGGRLVLHVGRQVIDLSAFATGFQNRQETLKQTYGYLFTQAAGKKDHILEKDLSGPNAVQFQVVRVMFETADRDADGKLTKAEFDAYFDLQDGFRNISLSLTPAVQTPTLFQLLDESRDGRLSVRELRTAWDRLVVLEAPGATVVTKNIIQPAVTLRLTRTLERGFAGQVPVYLYPNANQAPVPTKGPVWFRKMDRNADGDVSRIEFVGTKAEFDALDTDADDLISLAEAEAYDKKTREKEEK